MLSSHLGNVRRGSVREYYNSKKTQNLLVRLVLTKLDSALQANLPLQYSANQWNISPRKGGFVRTQPSS